LKDNSFIFSNVEELKEWLLNVREKYYVELKKAQELPNAFWETYSSFCNTAGGVVVLGVVEGEAERPNAILGVGNVEKTLTSLWDQLNNKNKVSYKWSYVNKVDTESATLRRTIFAPWFNKKRSNVQKNLKTFVLSVLTMDFVKTAPFTPKVHAQSV